MNGDMEKSERDIIMRKFRKGYRRVMIKNEIIDRGIDVKKV
jgi:superfamily II DNA/RNA helicase